jgi:imidazoleglycerol-phosphate dehydratase / histidinol-phosphatase
MKRVLFIDRDGTLIVEPPSDFQVDSLEKLEFLPKVITQLSKIAKELPYELVIVTNQDGLGTASFPEQSFWLPHNKMTLTLENEGIRFHNVLIDRSFEYENAPTRKPRTGLLQSYLLNPEYDLANSFVIGDRITDMQLAYNLGAKGILVGEPSKDWGAIHPSVEEIIELITQDWEEIYQFLTLQEQTFQNNNRIAQLTRKTSETQIKAEINLDGTSKAKITTGIGFLNHMIEQIVKHAKIDLSIEAHGDLHIDEHHTIEDVGIVLGQVFAKALGNKKGIERYGFFILPMDEALAQVAIDFSGRTYFGWDVNFHREKVGQMPTEMVSHFFQSFAEQAKCNLHIQAKGVNDHHIIEAIFKCFAKAVRMAIHRDKNSQDLPSTKGVL